MLLLTLNLSETVVLSIQSTAPGGVAGVVTDIGCAPLRGKTTVMSNVIAESTQEDGWSGSIGSGWGSSRVHRVSWPIMTSGEVEALTVLLQNADLLYKQVLVEIEDQEPLIGRIIGKPSITHHNAISWSAELVVQEDL